MKFQMNLISLAAKYQYLLCMALALALVYPAWQLGEFVANEFWAVIATTLI